MYTFGYVSVVGKPNAGKSTLVNKLVGEKVAIVSDKPQTTRNNILGIKNGENYQIVLVDTPGIHPSKNHLDKFMMKNVRTALAGVDLIVYLLDSGKFCDQDEKDYIEKLKAGETPILVVQTKTDREKKCDYESDLSISSVTGDNIDKLVAEILDKLPKSETKNFQYDEDDYTNKSVRFLVAENIRELALKNLNREIPHGLAIDIIRFEEKPDLTIIEADIVCEKDSHKGIIIGKQGATLKKIGEGARKESEKLLGTKVLLKLFVKVEEDWRNKPSKLNSFGYNDRLE